MIEEKDDSILESLNKVDIASSFLDGLTPEQIDKLKKITMNDQHLSIYIMNFINRRLAAGESIWDIIECIEDEDIERLRSIVLSLNKETKKIV